MENYISKTRNLAQGYSFDEKLRCYDKQNTQALIKKTQIILFICYT